jgi:hypothetical protein
MVNHVADGGQTFAKKDLPEKHRVLRPGDMKTMDHEPDRYVCLSVIICVIGRMLMTFICQTQHSRR